MSRNKIEKLTENEFIARVFFFNKERNGFDLKGENELKMLGEESKEFFIDSVSIADRLDALVDFEFVYFGTIQKVSGQFSPVDPMIDLMCQNAIKMMKTILMGEMKLDEKSFEMIHARARLIVANANDLKGSNLDENGKVIKPDDLPNATKQIVDMLKKYYD